MEKQKYIEASEFEMDDWFLERLNILPFKNRKQILVDVLAVLPYLPEDYLWQQVSGVIKGDDPFFYTVEYINEFDDLLCLLDVWEVDCDEYLDSILSNTTIEHHVAIRKSERSTEGTDGPRTDDSLSET